MNDDLVQPNRGFGAHPHQNTEICTYIVDGKLTHKDSMGTKETLSRRAIQFMTAGTGVTHSEHNLDHNNHLRFIQIWINTRQRGLKPSYGSFAGDKKAQDNQWAHLVSDVKSSHQTGVKINQDANIYVTEVSGENTISFNLSEGRQAYLLCVEGAAQVQGEDSKSLIEIQRHDAAELYGPLTFQVTPKLVSELDKEKAKTSDG